MTEKTEMGIGFFIEALSVWDLQMNLSMLNSVRILRNIQRTIRTIYKREKDYWGADHRRARNMVLRGVRQIYTCKI